MAPFKKLISIVVAMAFCVTSLPAFAATSASVLMLPKPGTMIHLSSSIAPSVLKGLRVHPNNPMNFEFVMDKGDSYIEQEQLKQESTKLIKYFLASITTPEKEMWVNLSPYEKQRIVPDAFGQTEMGRDLLAQDYILKQITASLIYPEDVIGKKFWQRVYEEAAKRFGSTNIPVNTFNKVWIVPDKAVVYENANAGTAYIVESKLKVMLEQDYLALEKNSQAGGSNLGLLPAEAGGQADCKATPRGDGCLEDKRTKLLTGPAYVASQIIREIIIPQLTIEVNSGANFAKLRQVYNSLILATWYKTKIKNSILNQVYADKNKVAGVNIDDSQEKQKIYEQYLQAFKKGAYNFIKEEMDPVTKQMIPRKYFSGGFNMAMTTIQPGDGRVAFSVTDNQTMVHDDGDHAVIVDVNIKSSNPAMPSSVRTEGFFKDWDNKSYVDALVQKKVFRARVFLFEDQVGKKYYVKIYDSLDTVKAEFLSYQIAQILGVHVPNVTLLEGENYRIIQRKIPLDYHFNFPSKALLIQSADQYISSSQDNGVAQALVYYYFIGNRDIELVGNNKENHNVFTKEDGQTVFFDLFNDKLINLKDRRSILERFIKALDIIDINKFAETVSRCETLSIEAYRNSLLFRTLRQNQKMVKGSSISSLRQTMIRDIDSLMVQNKTDAIKSEAEKQKLEAILIKLRKSLTENNSVEKLKEDNAQLSTSFRAFNNRYLKNQFILNISTALVIIPPYLLVNYILNKTTGLSPLIGTPLSAIFTLGVSMSYIRPYIVKAFNVSPYGQYSLLHREGKGNLGLHIENDLDELTKKSKALVFEDLKGFANVGKSEVDRLIRKKKVDLIGIDIRTNLINILKSWNQLGLADVKNISIESPLILGRDDQLRQEFEFFLRSKDGKIKIGKENYESELIQRSRLDKLLFKLKEMQYEKEDWAAGNKDKSYKLIFKNLSDPIVREQWIKVLESYDAAQTTVSRRTLLMGAVASSLNFPALAQESRPTLLMASTDKAQLVTNEDIYQEAINRRNSRLAGNKMPNHFWDDEQMALHSIWLSLDIIKDEKLGSFREARVKNNIKTMVELYRKYVIAYQSIRGVKFNGAKSYFKEVGALTGLMGNPRKFLLKTDSPASLIRFALPSLIDLRNPDALDPVEVDNGYWNDENNAKYHILEALDSINDEKLGSFKDAREQGNIKVMVQLYRQYVKPKDVRGGQVEFYKKNGLRTLLMHKYSYLVKPYNPASLLRLVLPELIDKDNPDLLHPDELENDSAMNADIVKDNKKGGIDFNADKLNLNVQNSGQGIEFKIDPSLLEQLRNAPGFIPIILNIQPMTDLKVFLGIVR